MKILCDVDGVLIDMLRSIKEFLSHKGIDFKPENVETYGFDGDIGCSKSDVYALFKNQALYKNLYWVNGAVSGLLDLMEKGEVWAYTSVDEAVKDLRQSFVDYLGMEGEVYVGEKPVLDEPDIVVIEDCLDTCKRWLSNPTAKIFLVDWSYNREENLDPRIVRVPNVSEVSKYI